MNCRKSTIQNYECQVMHNGISFDACLAKELFSLWDMGIITTGCCCGNHVDCDKNMSYIGVDEKFIKSMKELGYVVRINKLDKLREDSFIPKTIRNNNEVLKKRREFKSGK